MKLTASMMLSVDGVYQGPGSPDEDRRGGFDRGGWVAAFFDEETGRFVTSVFERADALLLGRRTWEIFEGYWPHHDEGDPISHGINVLPKYVPSTTLKDPAWQKTHVIDGDVETAVRELKAKPGRELQVHGRAVDEAGPGRTAINVVGTDADDLHRGMVLTDDPAVVSSDHRGLSVRLAVHDRGQGGGIGPALRRVVREAA